MNGIEIEHARRNYFGLSSDASTVLHSPWTIAMSISALLKRMFSLLFGARRISARTTIVYGVIAVGIFAQKITSVMRVLAFVYYPLLCALTYQNNRNYDISSVWWFSRMHSTHYVMSCCDTRRPDLVNSLLFEIWWRSVKINVLISNSNRSYENYRGKQAINKMIIKLLLRLVSYYFFLIY